MMVIVAGSCLFYLFCDTFKPNKMKLATLSVLFGTSVWPVKYVTLEIPAQWEVLHGKEPFDPAKETSLQNTEPGKLYIHGSVPEPQRSA